MSKAKVDEWLHADRGSPWRHAIGGNVERIPPIRPENPYPPEPEKEPPPGYSMGPFGLVPTKNLDEYLAHRSGIGRDGGGGIAGPTDPTGTIGGITPSASTMNPMQQSMIQRYASMSPEALAEMGVRLAGTPQGALVQRLLSQKRIMPNAAPNYRRGGAMKREMGGMMSMGEADPWWARREATGSDSGFLHGTTGGRTDAVKTQAPGGSYVIPADVIAGLGEGNSLAGARVASAIFGTGPFGTSLPRMGGGHGPPHPPAVPRDAELKTGGPIPLFKERARGGQAGSGVKQGNTPVDLSHGEFVLGPEDIKRRFGVEDPKHAYPLLDKWVVAKRKEQVAKLQKLPGPVKSK